MPRAPLVLFLLVASFSFVGFGCKERPDPSVKAPGGIQLAKPVRYEDLPRTKPSKPENVASPEIRELRQILTNLAKAKSYRMTIAMPYTLDNASGVLLFSRDQGIHATLTTLNTSSEIFIKNNAMWVRYATSSWQPVPESDETRTSREQMRRAFAFKEDGTSSILLRDSAKILEKTNDRSGCTLYKIEQKFYVPVEETQKIELCVTSSYPKSIRFNNNGEVTTISYDNFDDPSILAASPIAQ